MAGATSKMKILITGGAGFIGSNLVKFLLESSDYKITVLDNLSVGQRSYDFPPSVEFIRGDFTDSKTINAALNGIDAVVHLAALSGVIDSVIDPVPSFKINAEGSFQLLYLAKQAGVRRIVNASTGGAILGDVTPPISESMAPSPLSPYGATKLAVEGYCSAFSGSYGLPCISLRFSNIYGPGSAHKKSVVASFMKNAIQKVPLTVYGDGTQERDYLFVGDLVRGIKSAIDSDLVGTFQLGSGKPTSLLTLIKEFEAVLGQKMDVVFEKSRKGEVHRTWCDIAKASEKLGFSPTTDLISGLSKTWKWFDDRKDSVLLQSAVSSSD